jgi:hypothetical protein
MIMSTLILCVAVIVFCLFPSIVASVRRHHAPLGPQLLNLAAFAAFAAGLYVGHPILAAIGAGAWFAALVWASAGDPRPVPPTPVEMVYGPEFTVHDGRGGIQLIRRSRPAPPPAFLILGLLTAIALNVCAVVAHAGGLPVPPPQAGGPEVHYAEHNQSLMAIETRPNHVVRIVYAQPRPSIAAIGVTPGTVLVEGRWVNPVQFDGLAMVFSEICGRSFSYPVRGGTTPDNVLILSGAAPVISPWCQPVGFTWLSPNSSLVFSPVQQ